MEKLFALIEELSPAYVQFWKEICEIETPSNDKAAVDMLVAAPTSGAFPSGHTAAAFAVVFALKTAGSPLWKPALAVAIPMAFSRLYLYVHWPTDILGGIVVGALVGWAGAKLVQLAADRLNRKKA